MDRKLNNFIIFVGINPVPLDHFVLVQEQGKEVRYMGLDLMESHRDDTKTPKSTPNEKENIPLLKYLICTNAHLKAHNERTPIP